MLTQPVCPSCKIEGKSHMANTLSDQKAPGGMSKFEIIHCDECGYVYTVLAVFTVQT